jgi:hypothetical protein
VNTSGIFANSARLHYAPGSSVKLSLPASPLAKQDGLAARIKKMANPRAR